MADLFEAVASWRTLPLVLAVFGVAPGLVLRLIVRVYPREDPRRKELVAELYAVPRLERPLFVAEQLELGLTEGVPARVRMVRARRAKRRDAPVRLRRTRLNVAPVVVVVGVSTPGTGTELARDSLSQSVVEASDILFVVVPAALVVVMFFVVWRWRARRRAGSGSR